MTPILKNHLRIIAVFALVLLVTVGTSYYKKAHASIDSFSITPTDKGTDDIVGQPSAHYDITYSSSGFSGNLSQIVVTFPSGYIITPGSLDPATAINSSSLTTCSAIASYLCFKGDDSWLNVTSMTGNSTDRTITINFDSFDTNDLVPPYNIEFRILQGITNPTTAENISSSGITPVGGSTASWSISNQMNIDDDATGNSATLLTNDFDLVHDVLHHLAFIQEPSGPATTNDPYTSGAGFTTQPIVAAEDQYDNVVTNYSGAISLVIETGSGSVTYANQGYSHMSCMMIGGGVPVLAGPSAVDGIVDFSPANWAVMYAAGIDHESFSLKAIEGCTDTGINATTTPQTVDIVANELAWIQDPSGCISGYVCTTQGIIEAVTMSNPDFCVSNDCQYWPGADTDFSGPIDIGIGTGAGTLIGTSPQSMINGILNTIGLGYTNSDPTVNEPFTLTADTESFSFNRISGTINTAVTFVPTTAGTDNVAGRTNANYDIKYTDNLPSTSTLTHITLTFPSGYFITDEALDPATAIKSLDIEHDGGCNGTAGYICFWDDDTWLQVTSMVGNASARTITINLESPYDPGPIDMSGYGLQDFSFTILQGVKNPTTAGVQAGSGFIINDDTGGGTPQSPFDSVTIIAAPLVTLTSSVGLATQSSSIPVTATFSTDVTGFTLDDVAITNGTAQNFNAVSGSVYTFDIVPTAYGAVRINIAADVSQDSSSNGNVTADELKIAYQKNVSAIGGNYNSNTIEIPSYTPQSPTLVTSTPQTTSTPTVIQPVTNKTCTPYLTTFLRKGMISDAVIKLQSFLRKLSFFSYPTDTGKFGGFTEAAVKGFQNKYASEILTPQQLTAPTGFVMGYTLAKINGIECKK